jgi:predicted alpha/beta-hydrolase family hydrolase
MARSIAIVFVWRNNPARRSDTFPRIAQALAARGHAIHWYESRRRNTAHRIDRHMARLVPGIEASRRPHDPLHRRAIRVLIKGILTMASAQRLDFIRAARRSPADMAAFELDRFVTRLPAQRVYLIGHSAGAIAATQIWRNPKICGITGLGYAFHHPDHPPEPYRTRHLGTVAKPLLIIQGRADAYGSDREAYRPMLPDGCEVIPLACDHDYANLDPATFTRVMTAIQDHIDHAGV